MEAQRRQVVAGQDRRLAPFDHVGHDRPRHAAADLGKLLHRVRRLDETGIRAGLAGGKYPGNRFVHAGNCQGVGAGDDEEIPCTAGLSGGADLLHVFLTLNEPLALHVPALLRPELVLQKHPAAPAAISSCTVR